MSNGTTPSPPPPDSQINHNTSLNYWNSIPATINGMLGGYPQISRIDLQGSRTFIKKVNRQLRGPSATTTPRLAVDCGAGIGRITLGLLTNLYGTVDVVEPVEKFASALSSHELRATGAIGDVYITGLESWVPVKKYDLVWNQWCVGHLTDAQLVEYLRRAGEAVEEDAGWIGVKENLSGREDRVTEDLYDELDSSVTRSDKKFKEIFQEAGLVLLREEVQMGFPKGLGLFPVKMYALRPR